MMKEVEMSASDSFTTPAKPLKAQVERQRRERMNRSLDTLRVLLLQSSQHQGSIGRRIEKAEVLECTVSFLKKSCDQQAGEAERKQHIWDGFSDCLQRAAWFLHCRGLGQQVEAVLRCKLSPGTPPTAQLLPSPHWATVRQQCQKQRGKPYRRPAAPANGGNAQAPARSAPTYSLTTQSVWRPWP